MNRTPEQKLIDEFLVVVLALIFVAGILGTTDIWVPIFLY